MSITFFLLLIFLVLPLWLWLATRIWCCRELTLRPVFVASLSAFALLALDGCSEHTQEKSRTSAELEGWCKEKNDATYDPTLGTCVENGKEEALARSESKNIFVRMVQHFEKSGIKGEFDESASAAALLPQLAAPEIAKMTQYYFLPLSMSQPPLAVLLCVSEAACMKYEENARERGTTNLVRNANLLLVLPAAGAEEARISALTMAFLRFKAS